MSKHRLGWPDLLLLAAAVPALTGHFYTAMALLALYAVLYRRATHRGHRIRLSVHNPRLTRADVARLLQSGSKR